MRRIAVALAGALLLAAGLGLPATARDRPVDTSRLIAVKLIPSPQQFDLPGLAGGQFSKKQIQRFRCTSSGTPSSYVDMSCNTAEFGQDFAPDNEIGVAVDPLDPDHVLAGSNDYYYRFNNANGTRQAIVPTGFFTSFDGGESWLDGQIPMQSGNGAGDPAPAFNSAFECPGTPEGTCSMALMAQLENVAGHGGFFVAQGDVSVSRSLDGGETWETPVTVFKGQGAGIGPANKAVFWDKEYIAVDNDPASPNFGRIYVTATKFVNGILGSYTESPIYISSSGDGGNTWTEPQEISGSHPSCTFQTTGAANECDENQFSYPTVAPDGTVYVVFHNYQNEAAWEVPIDFDAQIMVVKSTDGGTTWSNPVPAVQIEDGLSDMPWSVISRQTIWGHQIRWNASGNIAVDPTNSEHVTIAYSHRGTANPNAPGLSDPESGLPCFINPDTGGLTIGTAPSYDPCQAGPGSDTDVFRVDSMDGGASWGTPTVIGDDGANGPHEWFPWGGYTSDGTLVAAWDKDTVAPGGDPVPNNDLFAHVLWDGSTLQTLGPDENVDVSQTHWAGQYRRSVEQWPAVCGPDGYTDPPVTDAEGKDCNVFHGDYTGLAVGSDDDIHVVWTGLNRLVTSPQVDFYTGDLHDGYAQDAMYARR